MSNNLTDEEGMTANDYLKHDKEVMRKMNARILPGGVKFHDRFYYGKITKSLKELYEESKK